MRVNDSHYGRAPGVADLQGRFLADAESREVRYRGDAIIGRADALTPQAWRNLYRQGLGNARASGQG